MFENITPPAGDFGATSLPSIPFITEITTLVINLTIISIILAIILIILKKKKISKIFIYVSLLGICFILSKGIIQGFEMSGSIRMYQEDLDRKVYISTIFSYILLLILIKLYKLRRK